MPVVAIVMTVVVVVVWRVGSDPDTDAIVAVSAIGALAILAVVAMAVDSRRIGRRLQHTIDELVRAETGIRGLLDDLPDAVMGLDEQGTIRSANRRAALLTGRTVDELVGRAFLEMIGDTDREVVTERWHFETASESAAAAFPR